MTTTNAPPPHDTDVAWQLWGERDPYFGVITDPRVRLDQLDAAARADFFASGRTHARHILRMCRGQFGAGFAPQRVLDFGCGVGRVLVGFAELAPEVVGLDVSPAMLAEAGRNCDAQGMAHVQLLASDDQLSCLQGAFDLVHSVIVFQHINPMRGRQLAARLIAHLRPGGVAALHFTYAKACHAEAYGQPPDPTPAPPTPARPQRRWGLGARAPAAAPSLATAALDADPEMQMNTYRLNDILFLVQRCGTRSCHLEFTDHGGELGVIAYFQRPAA